jgi:hypothetical protein
MSESGTFLDVTRELLRRGYGARFRAHGTSMHPTILDGETITVEPVCGDEIQLGDIVFYHTAWGQVIAHRVVASQRVAGETLFVIKGDAGDSQAECVRQEQILGRVVKVYRGNYGIDLVGRRAKMKHLVCKCSSQVRDLGRLAYRLSRRSFASSLISPLLFVLLLCTALPGRLAADIKFIQVVGRGNTTGASIAITPLAASPTTGNTLIVAVVSNNGATGVTVADNGSGGSNTYTKVSSTTSAGVNATLSVSVLTAPITHALTTASTITISGCNSTGNGCEATILEFQGIATSSSLDIQNTNTNNTTASTTPTVTMTTTNAHDLLFAAIGNDVSPGGFSAGTGYNQPANSAETSNSRTVSVEWAAQTVAGSKTANGTVTNSGWVIAFVALKASATTEIQNRSFTFTSSNDGNRVRLETGRDVNNLGFNLYRQQNGRRTKLNSSILAGSALLAGGHTVLTAGHAYSWLDDLPGANRATAYWLEEIDLNGKRTWYGPATPTTRGGPQSVAPTPISRLGRTAFLSSHPLERHGSAPVPLTPKPHSRLLSAASADNLQTQWALASGRAVKIGIQSEGWYRVSLSDLISAGLDPGTGLGSLRLFADGVEQPILLKDDGIEFYGVGADTTWTDRRTYWLAPGNGGQRVQSVNSQAASSSTAGSFAYSIERKDRTVYFAALLNGGDASNFFGPAITGDPVDQTLSVTGVSSSGQAQLQVSLQGVTAGSHGVDVQLNGNDLGVISFADQTPGAAAFAVSSAQLREGANVVTLASQGGDSDVSLVDSVVLTYPHSYLADSDALRFTASGGQSVKIGGFSDSSIRVVDITDPSAPMMVPGTVMETAGSFSVVAAPAGSGDRLLLAFTDAQVGQPVSITAHNGSSWHSAQPGADVVMIGHADFLPSLAALKTLRESQGHTVAVIDVQDLYDEFNFGQKSSYAIQDFLLNAQAEWQTKPRFVLLVGDATFDPHNYLGLGDFDFVPTKLVDTAVLETASDDWFADFNGDGVPQIAIGRLPVRTAAGASALVAKIASYEQAAPSAARHQALLVAGANDSDNDFESATSAVKALLPNQMGVTQIYSGQMAEGSARSQLLTSLSGGQSLVNYVGHGSSEVWQDGLLSTDDIASLTNSSQLPFFVSMTCLNGFFQDLYTTSLAKALVNTGAGGAIAAWASSGLTSSGAQAPMNQALIQALYGGKSLTIGEAVGLAKKAAGDLDVRRTWNLLGDPATKLQ